MPKNSAIDVLRRWRAMDRDLSHGGLHVPRFARRWKVSDRTVRRDLEDFHALGQATYLGKRDEDGRDTYYHWYRDGTRPLFTSNSVRPKIGSS
jgi:hypothetical protein